MPIAFIDESARYRVDDSCIYALAAVIIDADDVDDCRLSLNDLRYGKSPTVHWRLERPERRILIAGALADMPIQGVVAVATYTRNTRVERARRQCLARLLPELILRDTSEAELESRGTALDQRDRQLLTGLRKSNLISDHIAVRWGRPSTETMLWAADCVAGATTWWFGGSTQYLDLLGRMITLIDVP